MKILSRAMIACSPDLYSEESEAQQYLKQLVWPSATLCHSNSTNLHLPHRGDRPHFRITQYNSMSFYLLYRGRSLSCLYYTWVKQKCASRVLGQSPRFLYYTLPGRIDCDGSGNVENSERKQEGVLVLIPPAHYCFLRVPYPCYLCLMQDVHYQDHLHGFNRSQSIRWH